MSGKTREDGGRMPAVFVGGKRGDGGKTGLFAKVQKQVSVCSQIVYKHPLTILSRGGKLALALRGIEC
ncbi:MAG: hypothetical protein SO072_05595 [Dysosmobacter sp.]|nr:hypothetical protein [Dysosmobacter sp.]